MDCEFSKKEIIVPPIDPEDQREEGGECPECPECDFSICTVTITNEVEPGHDNVTVAIANTYDSETPDDPGDPTASYGYMPISKGHTYTFDCILYKGKAVATFDEAEVKFTVVSGDAEVSGYSFVVITGDCTLKLEHGGLS